MYPEYVSTIVFVSGYFVDGSAADDDGERAASLFVQVPLLTANGASARMKRFAKSLRKLCSSVAMVTR